MWTLAIIEKAPEGLKERARAGEVSVSAAYDEVRLIESLKTGSLREVLGPDKAAAVSELPHTTQKEAVPVIVENRLSVDEMRSVVEKMKVGQQAGQAVTQVLNAREAQKPLIYELRKKAAGWDICRVCKTTVYFAHREDGTHRARHGS